MKTKIHTFTSLHLLGGIQASALLYSAIAVAGISWISLATVQAQTVISVNFQGGNSVEMASSDSTGVLAAENWNNVTGTAGSAVALNDSTGSASGVTLTAYANDNHGAGNNSSETGNATAQAIFFGGSLDATSWFGPASFAVEGLSMFSSYDLVIYYSGIQSWAGNRTGNFSVSGTDTKYYFRTSGSSADFTDFAQSDSTVPDVFAEGNHVVFSGLTGGTATVLMENLSEYVAMVGFQIIGTPGTGQPDPFATWIADNYPALTDKTAAGDPDGDGMSNYQEFAFGLDPSSGASINPITTPLDKNAGTLSYVRREPSVTGLTYKVMTSTNLVDWAEDDGATASQMISATNDGVQTMAVTVSEALLEEPQLFVRVQAQ